MRWFEGMLLIAGILIFMVGFHSVDSAFNMKFIEATFNTQLTDTTPIGFTFTADEIYRNGLIELFAGFFLSVFMALKIELSVKKKSRISEKDIDDLFCN